MRIIRRFRGTTALLIALAASVSLSITGCGGGGGDGSVAGVSEEYAKKNENMLEKMRQDQIAKYKKVPGKR